MRTKPARADRNQRTTGGRPTAAPWMIAAALVVVVLAAYANSIGAGLAFDSRGLVLDDARVHTWSAANLAEIWRHTYWWPVGESGLYRPFTTVSYLINYAVLGHAGPARRVYRTLSMRR